MASVWVSLFTLQHKYLQYKWQRYDGWKLYPKRPIKVDNSHNSHQKYERIFERETFKCWFLVFFLFTLTTTIKTTPSASGVWRSGRKYRSRVNFSECFFFHLAFAIFFLIYSLPPLHFHWNSLSLLKMVECRISNWEVHCNTGRCVHI